MSKQKSKALSIQEFTEMFPDEQSAYEYVKKIIWPKGPTCPYCCSPFYHVRPNPKYFFCDVCRRSYTIRIDTIFQGSNLPFHKWLLAMYFFVTMRKGISSLQLSKWIGVTQKTAWFLLHRLRAACGHQYGKVLEGIVEADETYLGGREKNKHSKKKRRAGRGAVGKASIFGMRDRDGQVVIRHVSSTDKKTLRNMLALNVRPGAVLCTDEFASYIGLDDKYNHKTVNHKQKQYVDGEVHTNSIESVWAVLKRSFYGTYHSISPKYLALYAEELSFRQNEGNNKIAVMDRIASLVRAMGGNRLSRDMLEDEVFYYIVGVSEEDVYADVKKMFWLPQSVIDTARERGGKA